MSVDLKGDGDRVGLFRANQWRNMAEPDLCDSWQDILAAYRRYRLIGVPRPNANLLTIGYADGLRHGGTVIQDMASIAKQETADLRDRPYWASPDGPCEVWKWLGQPFYTCDECGWPYWHHTHEHGRPAPDGPFSLGPLEVIPITDDNRDAARKKWGPALAERNRKHAQQT